MRRPIPKNDDAGAMFSRQKVNGGRKGRDGLDEIRGGMKIFFLDLWGEVNRFPKIRNYQGILFCYHAFFKKSLL